MKKTVLAMAALLTIATAVVAQPPTVPGYGPPVVPVIAPERPAGIDAKMATFRELVNWDRLPEDQRKGILDSFTNVERAAFLRLDGVMLPPKKVDLGVTFDGTPRDSAHYREMVERGRRIAAGLEAKYGLTPQLPRATPPSEPFRFDPDLWARQADLLWRSPPALPARPRGK